MALKAIMRISSQQNYNRMINCHMNSMEDEEFDEYVHHKARIGNNSGYLDEEYELTKEFPSIPDYHFRIEDEVEILSLQKLRRESEPIAMEATFNNSSQQFKTKLCQLLSGLDSSRVQFDNNMEEEKHGFYTLADSYDDESVINALLEKARVEELRMKMEEVSIKDIKPVFIKKSKRNNKAMNQEYQVQKLSKKFNRITISQSDF